MEQNAPFVLPCSVFTNIPKFSTVPLERRKSKREGREVAIIVVFAVMGKGVEPKCGVPCGIFTHCEHWVRFSKKKTTLFFIFTSYGRYSML